MWKKSESDEPMTGSQPSLGSTPPSAPSAPASRPSTPAKPATASASSGPSKRELGTIGPSISIRGEVTGDEDLVILGTIEGKITLPNHDVTLGQHARVQANVDAKRITIEGAVTGDVTGVELVTIRRSGEVQGNIAAERVVLEDGCKFSGSIDMNVKPTPKQEAQPASETEVKKNSDKPGAPAPRQKSPDIKAPSRPTAN